MKFISVCLPDGVDDGIVRSGSKTWKKFNRMCLTTFNKKGTCRVLPSLAPYLLYIVCNFHKKGRRTKIPKYMISSFQENASAKLAHPRNDDLSNCVLPTTQEPMTSQLVCLTCDILTRLCHCPEHSLQCDDLCFIVSVIIQGSPRNCPPASNRRTRRGGHCKILQTVLTVFATCHFFLGATSGTVSIIYLKYCK